jgi:hypothetical protein
VGGGDTFSFADMLSVVGTTRGSTEWVSAGSLAGELCCESEPALLLVVVFEGEACSFAGDLTCVTREGSLAGELCCEVEPALLLVLVFEGEACSFSARRQLLLPCTIATKASPGVLSLGILVTAGERRQ